VARSPAKDDDPIRHQEGAPAPASAPAFQSETPIMPSLRPGVIVDGRLEIQSLIATGGFGSVYKVRHLMLNKTLALKTLHPVTKTDTTVLRLKRESIAVAKLDHPNIVHAMDFGLIDGAIPFILMEYVEGLTLSESLRGRPPLPVDEAMKMFIPLCEALAYAHDQGVIHRDIKPANIMLSLDERDQLRLIPKIVDFGIAKLTFGEDAVGMTLTRTGDVFGTPLYMSPEQCAGTSVDHRADIYSLGCVLFETLTGTPPFAGNSPLETMMRHASGEIPSLKEGSLGKEFPAALEFILNKMLAKEARLRYQSCYDVAHDLRLILQGDAASVRTTSLLSSTVDRPVGGRRIEALFVALIGIGALAAGIGCGIAIQPMLVKPLSEKISDPFTNPNVDQPLPTGGKERPQVIGFFHSDTDANVFHFPKDVTMGTLIWDNGAGRKHVDAKGDVTLPPNTNLILNPKYNLLTAPAYWGCFHPNDLWGIYMSHVTFLDTEHGSNGEIESADAAVTAAWQQLRLHVLELKSLALHERAFKLIGTMPNLSNLTLESVEIAHEPNATQVSPINASQISALPNLAQLDTIRLANIKGSVTPVLRKLHDSGHLRNLALWSDDLTEEDLETISKMSSLEHLDVIAGLPIEKQLALFSRMPNLKKLCIAGDWQRVKSASVYKFAKLETLRLFGPKGESTHIMNAFKNHLELPAAFDWKSDCTVDDAHPTSWFSLDDGNLI
jgi:serine/threonine protein kinase